VRGQAQEPARARRGLGPEVVVAEAEPQGVAVSAQARGPAGQE